jgi:hypothetical protein
MDVKKLNPKMLSIFDIIGSYFVDVYYNSHYVLAGQQVKKGT